MKNNSTVDLSQIVYIEVTDKERKGKTDAEMLSQGWMSGLMGGSGHWKPIRLGKLLDEIKKEGGKP